MRKIRRSVNSNAQPPRPEADESPGIPQTTMRDVWRMWLPLAASWLLMGAELPLLSAVVARLPDPTIHLAAYGGVVFPVALLIEAPIIMLLAASTALSRNWQSYCRIRRFMMQAGAGLTLLHVAVAFTPLFDLVARDLIGAPEDIIEPARLGLKLMTPWTWAIASRRFHQGVLIRFGHSKAVGTGTLVRLLAAGCALAVGYAIQTVPGIAVATAAVSIAVLSEALYAWWRVRPILRTVVQTAPEGEPLSTPDFLRFYFPLAMTALISLAVQPVLTAAVSRLPRAVECLAVWPALNGLVFMLRATGLAYTEVVIALQGRPGGAKACRRFMVWLSGALTGLLVVLTVSPLADAWFGGLAGLNPALAELGRHALAAALLAPALSVMSSFYQGVLVYNRRTRPITESVLIFLLTSSALLWAAVEWGPWNGLFAGMIALTLGGMAQTGWLRVRSSPGS